MSENSTAHNEAVVAVTDAWIYPGPNPTHHFAMQQTLRREWPVLAQALDALTHSVVAEQLHGLPETKEPQ